MPRSMVSAADWPSRIRLRLLIWLINFSGMDLIEIEVSASAVRWPGSGQYHQSRVQQSAFLEPAFWDDSYNGGDHVGVSLGHVKPTSCGRSDSATLMGGTLKGAFEGGDEVGVPVACLVWHTGCVLDASIRGLPAQSL